MRRPAAHIIHRYIGLSTAFFLLIILVSGFALNHAAGLGLDKKQVRWAWLLNWYNVQAPDINGHFQLASNNQSLALLDNTLFLRSKALEGNTPQLDQLQGAACTQIFCAALAKSQINSSVVVLFDTKGSIIEVLYDVPKHAKLLGVLSQNNEQRFAIQAKKQVWLADVDMTHWQTMANDKLNTRIEWAKPSTLSESDSDALYAAANVQTISWERVLGDIHSGRILGTWGPWIVDIIGLLVIALAMTGCWVWYKQARARRR